MDTQGPMLNFGKVRQRKEILRQAMQQIENLLIELEKSGKDLSQVRLKHFKKTHYQNCCCAQCLAAHASGNPAQKGLREMGFKVFFHEEPHKER